MNKVTLFVVTSLLCCLPLVHLAQATGEEELQLVPQLQQPQNSAQQFQPPATQPQTLFDIYGPVATTEPLPYIPIAIAIVVVLILVALLYYYLKRKREALPPPVPPWDIALTELAEAKAIRIPAHGLAYMDRASGILRRYIESRFAIKSTRKTTMEFLHGSELGTNPELQNFKGELQECLEQADMAKFAHLIPENDHLTSMEDSVTTFVIKTKPTVAGEQDKTLSQPVTAAGTHQPPTVPVNQRGAS